MPYRQQFLNEIKQGAIDGWHKHKILPSIAGVQALHESDFGRSTLAKAPNYNIFGIKASSDWMGPTVSMQTNEHINGRTVTVTASFRKYDSWGASVADYGSFFTSTEWRKNNYRHVVGERDYKKAAWALQNAGYATDPQYANKLIRRLEENNLQTWDADIDKAPTELVNKVSVGGDLTQAGRDYLKNIPVTMIGDSLGVGTEPYFKEIMPVLTKSNQGSRQLTHSTVLGLDATRILTGMLGQPNMVHPNLVVILGTNAGLARADVNNFIKIAGNRRIYWVNTASKGVINQSRRDNVTSEIKRAAETYSNVYLLDWDKHAASNWSSYYGSDSVHMNATGYKKHAEFIAQGIYEVLNSSQKEAPSIPKEQRDEEGKFVKKSHVGIENIEYDDGRFYSLKGESSIQDRDANLRFSRHHSSSFGWITRPANFDITNENELFSKALAKLKEFSEPKIEYEVPIKLLPDTIDVGDWVDITDHQYNPPLYVIAQVKSIRESETEEDGNTAVLSNYQSVESGLAAELVEAQQRLKVLERSLNDETKIELQVISSQGAVFDGDVTSTMLTAQLKLNGEILTNYADSYVWWRVVDPLSGESEWLVEGGPTLGVEQGEFKHSATYKVLAKKEGRVLSESKFDLTRVSSGVHKGNEEPLLAVDGETWTKADGTQWRKVNGVWEEIVDENKVSEIVNRDGVTVSFSDAQPISGKQGDVWFKLNPDGTESIMRNNGDDWYETVTNALNADGIIEGTMDFSIINAIHINASSITAGHADFLTVALHAINSKLTMDGTTINILNDDGSFIEMNNVPEIRSTASDGTSVILDGGRVHFYDTLGMSKGYLGTDRHDGTRDFGIFLSKGSGIFRFSRMADAMSSVAKYYTVEPGDARVSIITKLVQRGELPDGNSQDFVDKGNMIATLNGWAHYPVEWPTLRTGQQIKYQEEIIATEGDAYDDIWKFGPSSNPDNAWKIYFAKEAVFEGGFTEVSDRNIKHDILPTDIVALPEIEAFDFKKYAMDSDGRQIELGLVAQDAGVLRVPGEIEGVDIRMATMLALKGIQELQAIVKAQAEEIEKLKGV